MLLGKTTETTIFGKHKDMYNERNKIQVLLYAMNNVLLHLIKANFKKRMSQYRNLLCAFQNF